MPLTAQEKNQIAQLSVAAGVQTVATSAALSALGAGALGIVALPLIIGLQQQFNRVRFPKIDPLAALRATQPLQARGLQTRISADPFFGQTVISTVDQDASLSQFVRDAALRRIRASQDFSSIGRVREALVEGLAQTAADRGFRSSIDPSLRGGVFRETADSPLQFIEGDFLV